MKKFIMMAIALFGFAITASAQEPAHKTVRKTEKVVRKHIDHDGDIDKKKVEKKVVLKKDGTPDKRYKVTKTVVKKDGTPDRRFKENK